MCRHMASGAEDGSVALWDLDTMACDRMCTHMDGEVKTVSISHDSQYVAYAGEQDFFVMESMQAGENTLLHVCQIRRNICRHHSKSHLFMPTLASSFTLRNYETVNNAALSGNAACAHL